MRARLLEPLVKLLRDREQLALQALRLAPPGDDLIRAQARWVAFLEVIEYMERTPAVVKSATGK